MKNRIFVIITFCLFNYGLGNAQCLEQAHTPFEQDGWLSCQTSANPNPAYGESHWIMYDLGWVYTLDSTHFWNYNVWGNSDKGIKELSIDYSLDANTWTNLGAFELAQASSSVKYEGTTGPNFNNTPARYVLLTATSNWGNSGCMGLSELRFNISQTTSVDPELEQKNALMTVSPNPIVKNAEISFQADQIPESVALFDLSGKLLLEQTNIAAMNVNLNMEHLPGGIYFVKARLNKEVLTEKLIKI